MTLDEFNSLPPDQRKAVLADMNRTANDVITAAFVEELRPWLESQLVPKIPTKRPAPSTPTRVEVAPPAPSDPDQAARNFFRQYPETRSIRIGDTIYERN